MNKFLTYILLFFGFHFTIGQIDSLAIKKDVKKIDSVVLQKLDSVVIQKDSIDESPIDVSNFEPFNNVILNEKGLDAVFEKLYLLEKNQDRKVRILHIGDSHIQADIFTAKIRNRLEGVFGNGGFGFTFPYSIAKTNNNAPIKYYSSGSFSSTRNLFADDLKPIGLSGISLESNSSNLSIKLQVKDPKYNFNKIKVLTPYNRRLFAVSTKQETIIIKSEDTPEEIKHIIQPGEFLGKIAKRYKVSLKALKKINGIKGSSIRDGETLIIPQKKAKRKSSKKIEFVPIEMQSDSVSHFYESKQDLNTIDLIGDQFANEYVLNGIILENQNPGITYSAVGVNGAKYTDYSRFELFFKQLPATEADLIVLSFGTNESYDNQDQEKFYKNLKKMVDGIHSKMPNVSILVTTPPPSVHRNKQPNGYVEIYKDVILNHAENENYAVWDLLDVFGGIKNVVLNSRMGLMAKDKVHYSTLGYEKQGELFFDAFIQSYELYKSKK